MAEEEKTTKKKTTSEKPKKQVKTVAKEEKTTEKKTSTKKKPTTAKKTEKKQIPTAKKSITAKKPATKPKAKPKVEKKEEVKAETKAEKEETEEKIEEEEEKYKVKKKPEISKELKEKIVIRRNIKKRTPKFLREEWFRYKRIPLNWRRPDGITSKMRKNLKYRPSKVRVGFRGPEDARGLHPSGFEEISVFNINDLNKINPKKQAARIGGSVGMKKRTEIMKKAEELDIRILNM